MVGPTTRRRRAANVGVRVLLTLLGAAGLVIAAFLDWTDDIKGLDLSWRALYRTEFVTSENVYSTVGALSILLGLLLIVSLASWFVVLTRFLGALGVVMFLLFVIEIYRDTESHDVQIGAWVALAGSAIAVIGGFIPIGTTAQADTGIR